MRTGRGHAQQDNHQLQVSHLVTPDRHDDAGNDSDSDNGSDSEVEVDEYNEDEESTPIECAFFSKNIYNVLDVQTTPPPAVANAVANADDAVINDPNRSGPAADRVAPRPKCIYTGHVNNFNYGHFHETNDWCKFEK